MHKKYFLSSLLGLALSLGAFAQNNPGADYIALGELEMAKNYFMRTMRQTPAESYYYLGQIALKEGNEAEAKKSFQAGLNSNPESVLCSIGLTKLDLKANPKEASKELDNIKKKNKKDVTVLLEIARAYYENNMDEKGQAAVADARKADKNSPAIYIFEGDMVKGDDVGRASGLYEQAITFDSKSVVAYIKYANVYKNIQPRIAIDKLNAVLEIDPSNKLVQKYIADLYYGKGYYKDAIKAYETYMQSSDYTIDDITNLAASQFFTDDFSGATEVINKGLAKDPQHFVLNRLSMYSENSLENYTKANEVAETFFAIPRDTASYIERDYMTYANILSHLDKKAEAVAQFDAALELASTKEDFSAERYKTVATICSNDKMYEEAANFYKKYIANIDDADATDYFQVGNYYYLAGNAAMRAKNVEEGKALMIQADAEFQTVTEMKSDAPLGYLMRARVNATMDPETSQGLAKPHYEALANVVLAAKPTAEEATFGETELKEAYSYLSYFHYLQYAEKNSSSAKAEARDYVEKLLQIDPENNIGLQLQPVLK